MKRFTEGQKDSFLFTQGEKEFFRLALKGNFAPQQVEKFIHNAEVLLEPTQYVVLKQTHTRDYRYQIDKIIKQLQETNEKVRKLKSGIVPGPEDIVIIKNETLGKFAVLAPERWSSLTDSEQDSPKSYCSEEIQVMKAARESSRSLEKLSKSLQVVREKHIAPTGGRKTADHYGICLNLGYLYFKAFDELPSTTRGGPFIAVLSCFLEVFSLPCKDPTRMVKESLPKLKKGLEIERNHYAQLQETAR